MLLAEYVKNSVDHLTIKNKDVKMDIKNILAPTHKVVWDNSIDSSSFMVQCYKSLYGRYIYNHDFKIICADFPPSMDMEINIFPLQQHHNTICVNLYENAHIIRVYYNHNQNKWVYCTSNCCNASKSVYRTNKNANVKVNNKSFYTFFKKYNKIDINQLSKLHTHIFSLIIPDIYITSKVTKGETIYMCKIDNTSLELSQISPIHTPTTVLSGCKILIDIGGKNIIYRTEKYITIHKMLNNAQNVYHAILLNLINIDKFVSAFPYWERNVNKIISRLKKYATHVLNLYNNIYYSYDTDYDDSGDDDIDMIMINALHLQFKKTKRRINYQMVWHILITHSIPMLAVITNTWL